ncbi:MAG: hypothetical protein COX65_05435 [Elusimicrobia bacterium CG_4_10_14_0_2_um_filter_56_8]|nr:MAG: hypothetical protein AUJ51_09160 [Elusimicrobia bacterium CG1_02_56_21]PJA14561.1 MAG: hypothetical protein COX65_05435 [Elusimicrobia bacterium CG_4_10_14_0_2_um_filter_56_8]
MKTKFKVSFTVKAWIAAAVPAFLLLAAGDLALRSRDALLKAREQAAWRDNPGEKAAHYAAWFQERSEAIEKDSAAGKLTAEQSGRAAVLAAAERDFLISESSSKQAFLWYKTAADDFYFPFNPWAQAARKELPGALAAWRAELAAKGVKLENWRIGGIKD